MSRSEALDRLFFAYCAGDVRRIDFLERELDPPVTSAEARDLLKRLMGDEAPGTSALKVLRREGEKN